ncbi:hypothetical protein SDC9_77029 [bioreactor metagenome]|uniref:Uncharacterized protein n=1 Tax=bioreactor metagenome TaxID=1076179 RepID=A0A644YQ89_9ZZZZ
MIPVINKDISVSINEEKIVDDSRLDGLKEFITNTRLTHAGGHFPVSWTLGC